MNIYNFKHFIKEYGLQACEPQLEVIFSSKGKVQIVYQQFLQIIIEMSIITHPNASILTSYTDFYEEYFE